MGRGHVAGSDWSNEEIDSAAALWRDGFSASHVAARLGGDPKRTRNAVLGMMSRHRDKFPKRTPEGRRPGGVPKGSVHSRGWSQGDIATAQRMWLANLPAPEIGEAIGRSGAAVQNYAHDHPDLFPPRERVKRQPAAAPDAAAQPIKTIANLAERYPAPPSAPDCKPVEIWRHVASQCAYPLWEHGDLPTAYSLYCGGDAKGDSAYCAYHRTLMYRPPTVKPEREEPLRASDRARRRAA